VPDMGYRDNVMGPQPIAQRKSIPPEVIETVARFLELLAAGKASDLAAMAVDSAKADVASLSASVKAGVYNDKRVIATARTNEHFWIKAKLAGPDAKPFTLQLRVGPSNGKWLIWAATNLSESRSAWTK